MALLEALNLKKYYGKGSYLVKAVDDISFGIDEGEFVAVVGTSGSGKTTLLNLLGGLDTADSGKVVIRGKSLLELGDEERTVFRRRNIGFVFQNYNLLPEANVYQNIILPIRLDGSKNVDEEYVAGLVEKLGLGDKLRVRPNQLSGGQQQRVAIARALSTKPAIVLADEPTGSVKLVQHYPKEIPVILFSLSMRISEITDRHSVRFSSRVSDS